MTKEQTRTISNRILERQRRRSYVSVRYQDRMALIQEVVYKNRRIVDASKEIGVNCSTAKMIIYKYKRSGVIYQKKQDRIAREEKEKIMMIWYSMIYQMMWWQNYWSNIRAYWYSY